MSEAYRSTRILGQLIVLLALVGGALVVSRWQDERARTVEGTQALAQVDAWHEARGEVAPEARAPFTGAAAQTSKRLSPVVFDPSSGMSEQCEALNIQVIHAMQAIHRAGGEPPFPVDPLMEVLRTSRCAPEDPSVRVIMSWLQAGQAAVGL